MKKHRKQLVNVLGEKRMVDVPVDSELYKSDNHEEYQRARSKAKHVSLDGIVLVDFTADVTEAYEETEIVERLHKALQALDEEERQLVKYLYYDGFVEREVAAILEISQPAVTKRKQRIIQKLRNSLIDWT
jgi:RNA polymerase sigma factor (sigma-70 family)